MTVGHIGYFSAARSPLQESFLDQEWLVHFFKCSGLFANRYGDRRKANRAATILLDDRQENTLIHFIETMHIDFKRFERDQCNVLGDLPGAFDLREVSGSS